MLESLTESLEKNFETSIMCIKYIYLQILIDIKIERLISFSNKHNLHLKSIAYFADFFNFSPSSKVRKIAVESKQHVQSPLQLSIICFVMLLLTENFDNYFC